jgi:hypothetical protein
LAYGECLGGALYVEDFRRILAQAGCPDYRIVSQRKISINDPIFAHKAGAVDFYSMTVRAFKLYDLEDRCEDYGQVAYYQGTMDGSPNGFILDDHHAFVTGNPLLVCGNTASMITNTRYGKHFKVVGNRDKHFGLFPCSPACGDVKSTGSCC